MKKIIILSMTFGASMPKHSEIYSRGNKWLIERGNHDKK